MSSNLFELSVTRKYPLSFTVTIKNSDQSAYDLTGKKVVLYVIDKTKTSYEIEEEATISDPPSGIAAFSLDGTDTDIDVWKYDARIGILTDPGDATVYPLGYGTFEIKWV